MTYDNLGKLTGLICGVKEFCQVENRRNSSKLQKIINEK